MRYTLEMLARDPWGRGARPAMDHRGGSQESHYHPAIAREVLARMLCGISVRKIAADEEMPSYATLFQWLKIAPDFHARYEGARAQLAAERMAVRVGPRSRAAGRRLTYTPRAGRAVCRRLLDGEPLYRITARADMPSAKAVSNWLRRVPEFRRMVMEARRGAQAGLEFRAHLIMDVARENPARLAEMKRALARIQGHAGRLTARTYRPDAVDDEDGADRAGAGD